MSGQRLFVLFIALILAGFGILAPRQVQAQTAVSSANLNEDTPVTLRFYGSRSADLFTREVADSFQGVLEDSFYPVARDGFPAGFVSASLPGFPWAGTMWTRDAGTFLRELVMRGYYQHASLLAECLMHLVEKNSDGYYAFPRYFRGSTPGSGTEFDGTSAIVIGLELLWERLPEGNPARRDIQQFLSQPSSPVNYFRFALRNQPLIAGTGEFGCGWMVPGVCYNVVQNNLIMLALFSASRMESEEGKPAAAAQDRLLAMKLGDNMDKYLAAKDGSWMWAISTKTLKPDPAVLNSLTNRGTGSLNGVGAMYADVLGFLPVDSSWDGVRHSDRTFDDLYRTPLRKSQFDRYGIWTQYDLYGGGLQSGASYAQGYATQVMLLYDKLKMAGRSLDWLANATYNPVPGYQLHRASPYYFYERMYSPDAVGKVKLVEGCGALNLVNVAEPLKISRLLLGVDDLTPGSVRIIPRIPSEWHGVEAANWPIWTGHAVVRAHLQFERKGTGAEFTLHLAPGQQIEDLKVRMPSKGGYVWREQRHASNIHFITQ